MKQHITIVDDDKNILTSVSMALEAEGFLVTTYDDSTIALTALVKQPCDLTILDMKMPRLTGLEVLRRLREHSAMPVVFLTSMDDEIDQFLGLRMGADDYITKPFSQRLLIERIRAILRREQMRLKTADAGSPHLLRKGSLSLDEDRHICLWKNMPVVVTVTEFLIIRALAQNFGNVKSREQLLNAAFDALTETDIRSIDTHIKRIRRKFKEADPSFDHIETVYGLGYRFKDA